MNNSCPVKQRTGQVPTDEDHSETDREEAASADGNKGILDFLPCVLKHISAAPYDVYTDILRGDPNNLKILQGNFVNEMKDITGKCKHSVRSKCL